MNHKEDSSIKADSTHFRNITSQSTKNIVHEMQTQSITSKNELNLNIKDSDMRRRLLSSELEIKKKRTKYRNNSVEFTETIKNINNDKRLDAYGNQITKDKRKQKVTFLDLLNPSKQLITEKFIESFKDYNIAMSYPDIGGDYIGKKVVCCSCLIL